VQGGGGLVLERAREVGNPFWGGGEEKAHRRRCFHGGAAQPMTDDGEGLRRMLLERFVGLAGCSGAQWFLRRRRWVGFMARVIERW
jgi:hypothetical protein